MPAINENLKRIRSDRGLTQEAVAEMLGVTRQTVSSYELGRTRPDVETLKRFAEVYRADFYDILYGEREKSEKTGELRLLSIAALTISFLSGLLRAALRFTADTFFFVQGGTEVTDSIRAVLDKRFALLDAGSTVEAISLTLFGICCIIQLYLMVTLKNPVKPVHKLKYLGVFLLGSAVSTLPWMLLDHTAARSEYCFMAVPNLLYIVLTLTFSFPGELMMKKVRAVREKKQNSV